MGGIALPESWRPLPAGRSGNGQLEGLKTVKSVTQRLLPTASVGTDSSDHGELLAGGRATISAAWPQASSLPGKQEMAQNDFPGLFNPTGAQILRCSHLWS